MTRNRGAKRQSQPIVIADGASGLPYSKGLTANDVIVSGLPPHRAYQVAEQIEKQLVARGTREITVEELRDLTVETLEEMVGDRYARNYLRWQHVRRLDQPLVVLIGGATGVGKSTIATLLAARLGIVRSVPSDAIREVMRALFSRDLMPTLYVSSFEADAALREPPPRAADRAVVGFREQTAAVSVGVEALIERAAIEGTSAIVEGAHVVPGFVDLERYQDRVVLVPVIVTVEDEELHRGHFVARGADAALRPFDRYIRNFSNIRRIQRYIKSQALHHGWPVMPNYNLDQAFADVLDLVIERASERVEAAAASPTALAPEPALEGGAL